MTKGKDGNGTDARELASDVLMEILERDGLSHVVLNQALGKYQIGRAHV